MQNSHRDTEVVATTAPEPAADIAPAPEHAPIRETQPSGDARLASLVEALLITSPRAMTAQRLAEALGLVAPEEHAAPPLQGATEVVVKPKRRASKRAAADDPLERIASAIAALNTVYTQSARAFRIEHMAGGYRFMTLPEFGSAIAALQGASAAAKLSRAAVETLAIIAYKQPITRGKLEAVRGCACGEVLKSLLDRRLITIAGRAEELGRPLLYATSRAFLDAFGLASLRDLPTAGDLKS